MFVSLLELTRLSQSQASIPSNTFRSSSTLGTNKLFTGFEVGEDTAFMTGRAIGHSSSSSQSVLIPNTLKNHSDRTVLSGRTTQKKVSNFQGFPFFHG